MGFDIQNSCRCCCKQGCPFRNIFEIAVEENSFADILDLITPQFSDQILSSNLSLKICFRCQENAIVFYEFQKTVFESQDKIFKILQESMIHEEMTSENVSVEALEEAVIEISSDSQFKDFQFDQMIEEIDLDQESHNSDLESQGEDSNDQPTMSFSCEICKSSFDNSSELQQHTVQHGLSYPCQHCKREFSTSDRLQQHSATHKVTENRSILKSKAITRDEKSGRFICQICHSSYATRNILTHHLIKHSKNFAKNFACHLCPREFHFEKDLRVHIKQLHLHRFRFRCTECLSDYSTASALKKHVLTHTDNAKNFRCDTCEMAFKTKGSLEVHSRTHNGAKPFICPMCPDARAFSQKIILQRHMKTVHDENIYKCDWCSLTFEKHGELREHWKDCENFRNRNKSQDLYIITTEEIECETNERNESAVRSIKICINED